MLPAPCAPVRLHGGLRCWAPGVCAWNSVPGHPGRPGEGLEGGRLLGTLGAESQACSWLSGSCSGLETASLSVSAFPPVRMGRNSHNGPWHSVDGVGASQVLLLRPCLCLTEPLSLGSCHSPHRTGQAPGYSITHLSRLAPCCSVSCPFCHPLSVPVPPPQGSQRREG